MAQTKEIRIALLGTKFMGRTHSNAFSRVTQFFNPKAQPVMAVVCGRDPVATQDLANRFGWHEASTDWKSVVNRPDIDLVDVSTTGNAHMPMVLEAAKAGKHILCEKPLANTLAEARTMLKAVKKAKVLHMVGFNYRFVPAISLARRMIKAGKLGRIHHWRAHYLQDWIVDPKFPFVWRLDKKQAGSGALGDIAAHSIDLSRYLIGEIDEVVGMTKTFINKRKVPGTKKTAKVTVDDAAAFMVRFKNGAMGTFEASRFATGRKNANGFEIYGEKGSLAFDLEDLNRLKFYDRTDGPLEQGFKDIIVTEGGHPYAGAWWPAGHIIGYEHSFVHEVYELLNSLANGSMPVPNFEDGVRCQEVLEAVERSARSRRWIKISSV
jgi:predicted dehydrogenase